jgi:hypothetical protein
VDLGQFFASSGGLVLKDFSLCGVFIGAGTRIGLGVSLGCTSPEDKAIQAKAAAEAASKAAAEKAATDAANAAKDKAAQDAADKVTAQKKIADLEAQVAKIAAKAKNITITCIKGKTVKKVTGIKPVCPKGYKKK